MSVVKEIIDGVKTLSESIENIRTVVKAAKDGKDFLKSNYKSVIPDVVAVFEEMKKSLETMSDASSIITTFAFVDDPNSYPGDLREFNTGIRDAKTKIVKLKNEIDDYRGHCHIIREHERRVLEGTKLENFFSVFGVDSTQKRAELSGLLRSIYNEEQQQYLSSYRLCECVEKAIDDIMLTLGGPAVMKPEKVPETIPLLASYAREISKIQSQANRSSHEIRELMVELSR